MITKSLIEEEEKKPIAGGWDGVNRSEIILLEESKASELHHLSSDVMAGETNVKTTIYNFCKFNVNTSNRLGFTTSLLPMDLSKITDIGLGNKFPRNNGLYIHCKVSLNGHSVREMIHSNFCLGRETDNHIDFSKDISSNRILKTIAISMRDRWVDAFKNENVVNGNNSLNKAGMLCYNLLFFIPEEVILRDRMFYEPDLDLTIFCNRIEQKIYHPSFKNSYTNELVNTLRKQLIEEGCYETIIINSKNKRFLYRRVGDHVVPMVSRKFEHYKDDGVIIQTLSINDKTGEFFSLKENISFDDTERLKYFGLFTTKEEALLHNSEYEVNRLKHEITEIELAHKLELQKLRKEEAEVKYKNTVEEVSDKSEERIFKKKERIEDRIYKEKDRDIERKWKLEDRFSLIIDKKHDRKEKEIDREYKDRERKYKEKENELLLKEKENEYIVKQKLSEIKLEEARASDRSKSLLAGASIITGVGAIIAASNKIMNDNSNSNKILNIKITEKVTSLLGKEKVANKIGGGVVKGLKSLSNNVSKVVKTGSIVKSGIVSSISSSSIDNLLKSIFSSGILGSVAGIIGTGVGVGVGAAGLVSSLTDNSIIDTVGDVCSGVYNTVKDIGSGVVGAVKEVAGIAGDIIGGVCDGVVNLFGSLF